MPIRTVSPAIRILKCYNTAIDEQIVYNQLDGNERAVWSLIVDLQNRYVITSNCESGFGRYDVMLEPKNLGEDDAIILEFKIHDPEEELSLKDTVHAALTKIEEKITRRSLLHEGYPRSIYAVMDLDLRGKKY